jgi:hypothetical protein
MLKVAFPGREHPVRYWREENVVYVEWQPTDFIYDFRYGPTLSRVQQGLMEKLEVPIEWFGFRTPALFTTLMITTPSVEHAKAIRRWVKKDFVLNP